MEYPVLRQNIQLLPYRDEKVDGFLIQDMFMKGNILFVNKGAIGLLSLLDGKHTVRDIQYLIMKQTGQIASGEELQKFVSMLDDNYFLDNDNYKNLLKKIHDEYKSTPVRPPLMAGDAYPEKREELKTFLEQYFAGTEITQNGLPDNITAMVMPHIDIQRGGNVYAGLFKHLSKYPPPDTCIVFGVNHHYVSSNPIILTDRHYQTPLGTMEIDNDIMEELLSKVEWDLFEDELAHKGEHSIEFPALFLKYIYPDHPMKIIPFLSNFTDKDDSRVGEFIGALAGVLKGQTKRVMIIASVDFSHIGPQFGWQREVSSIDAGDTEREDKKTIEYLERSDAEGFYRDIMRDGNKRNIDALASCYIMLRLLNSREGKLISYEQAYHPYNTVTFAGLMY